MVLEILAGVLIGPAVIGFVEVDLPLEILALIGLAFLLFLAGSEIDLKRLRGGRLRGAATGFMLSSVLALDVAFALRAAGLIEAPLFVTIMLSATALGIVIPVLADAWELDSTLGQQIIAAASIADFAAVICSPCSSPGRPRAWDPRCSCSAASSCWWRPSVWRWPASAGLVLYGPPCRSFKILAPRSESGAPSSCSSASPCWRNSWGLR